MSTESRKKKHKDQLKSLMLMKAVEIISQQGYENFTIRKLASKIDYSPRTIYIYFGSKDDILGNIIEKVFEETLSSMETAETDGNPAEEIIKIMISRHIRNALMNPGLYKAVILRISSEEHQPGPSEVSVKKRIQSVLEGCLPALSLNDSADITEIFIATLRSVTILLINKFRQPDEEHVEKMIILYTKIILGGIL